VLSKDIKRMKVFQTLALALFQLLSVALVHCRHVFPDAEETTLDIQDEFSQDVIDLNMVANGGGEDQLIMKTLSRDKRGGGPTCKLVLYRGQHMRHRFRTLRKRAKITQNKVKSIRAIGDCCWLLSNNHRLSSIKIGGKHGKTFQTLFDVGLGKGKGKGSAYVKYIKRLNTCD